MRNVLYGCALLTILMTVAQTSQAQITDPGPGGGGQPLMSPGTESPPALPWRSVFKSPAGSWLPGTFGITRWQSPNFGAVIQERTWVRWLRVRPEPRVR